MVIFPPHLEHLGSLSCCLQCCSQEIVPGWSCSPVQLWFSHFSLLSFSPACPGHNFLLCLILLEIHCVCRLRCFPRFRKTLSYFKGCLLHSTLYKTPTKCTLDGFSFYFPYLRPIFHSLFCFHILRLLFYLSFQILGIFFRWFFSSLMSPHIFNTH